MNLPNKLTVLRVIMIPFFVVALMLEGGTNQTYRMIATAIFVIASLTDFLDGNIAIEPYREGQRSACDYCDYKGVCGFDPTFAGNRYRKVKKADKEQIWKQIEEGR